MDEGCLEEWRWDSCAATEKEWGEESPAHARGEAASSSAPPPWLKEHNQRCAEGQGQAAAAWRMASATLRLQCCCPLGLRWLKRNDEEERTRATQRGEWREGSSGWAVLSACWLHAAAARLCSSSSSSDACPLRCRPLGLRLLEGGGRCSLIGPRPWVHRTRTIHITRIQWRSTYSMRCALVTSHSEKTENVLEEGGAGEGKIKHQQSSGNSEGGTVGWRGRDCERRARCF